MTTRRLLLVLSSLLVTSLVGCAEPVAEEEQGESDSHLENSPPVASSSTRDAVVDQARKDRLVGEESTGYLGLVTGDVRSYAKAPSDLQARVSHINIQRRALYTEIAVKNSVTVNAVAQTTACKLFEERVKIGEAYRKDDAQWEIHSATAPVVMPAFCNNGVVVTVESVTTGER